MKQNQGKKVLIGIVCLCVGCLIWAGSLCHTLSLENNSMYFIDNDTINADALDALTVEELNDVIHRVMVRELSSSAILFALLPATAMVITVLFRKKLTPKKYGRLLIVETVLLALAAVASLSLLLSV